MDRTEKIRQFMEESLLIEFGSEVTVESDLFKMGVIDSFGYIHLMTFLEREFSLDIKEEDVLTNVFTSLVTIDNFVARKLAEPGPHQGDAACVE
jgi:acyl carrier protein